MEMSSTVAIHGNRLGRVGQNKRNLSNEVFNFDCNQKDNDRFQKIDAAAVEKERQYLERQKRLERDNFRRNWKSEIERSRWQKMATDYDNQKECLAAKQLKARIGKNSVSYNPITLEYHNTQGGEALAREDAKAMLRTSIRSLNLYLRNNTFDPMRCQDVSKDVSLVFGVNESKVESRQPEKSSNKCTLTPPKYGRRSLPPGRSVSQHTENLNVPKQLLNCTNSNAILLKNREENSVANILSFLKYDNEKWARHY